MSDYDQILATLRDDFRDAVRLAKVAEVPDTFLIVVDRCGEPMESHAYSKTFSDRESHHFSVALNRWLTEKSRTMVDAKQSEIAMAIRDEEYYKEKVCVFESLEEFAEWYARPSHLALDAFISYFIGDGFPIYGVAVFADRA